MLAATDQPDEVGWQLSGEGMGKMFTTEDFGEGLTAFIEKRDPVLEGQAELRSPRAIAIR
jgi:enoyl-CoA hydratase/carnithine racemase